jgi:hypothetical protein
VALVCAPPADDHGMLRSLRGRLVGATLLVLFVASEAAAGTAYSQTIYRSTAFSTQATDYFCTAAVAENITNLASGKSRHSRTHQARGVDPQGVEAMLERFIPGSDWRQVRTKSIQSALQAAARGMRATGLPAVLFVAGGMHAWTMNGYVSSDDPRSGKSFVVTQVRFSGPKYPKQTARLGWFDLPPNTLRSVRRLADAFFPYREALAFGDSRATPWNGYFVAVVPTRRAATAPGTTPAPAPTPSPTPTPTAMPTSTPEATNEAAPVPASSAGPESSTDQISP